MIDSYWQLVLIGIGAADGLLMVLYLLQRRTGDATLVDAGWGTAIAVQAGIYGALGPGRVEHRALIASAAGIESLRVAWVVVRRVGHGEDSRYRELRERCDEARAVIHALGPMRRLRFLLSGPDGDGAAAEVEVPAEARLANPYAPEPRLGVEVAALLQAPAGALLR